MNTNTTSALDMLSALIRQAKATVESAGDGKVALVLAPAAVVFHAMDQVQTQENRPALVNGHHSCMLVEGVIVLGYANKEIVSVWADDQFIVPGHDHNDRDDHAHVCPIHKPQPSEAEDPLGHAMWGIQMDDWLGHIGPTVAAMLANDTPILSAKIMP